jgi:hypothetical protein
MSDREKRLRAFIEVFDAFEGRIPTGLSSWMGEVMDSYGWYDFTGRIVR